MDSKILFDERSGFRSRLAGAMIAMGYEPSPTALVREFNPRADGAAVTVHAARKWLQGEAIPTQERMRVLAKWLRVSPEWLRYGEGEADGAGSANDPISLPRDNLLLLENFNRLDERSRAVVNDLILSLLKNHSLRS